MAQRVSRETKELSTMEVKGTSPHETPSFLPLALPSSLFLSNAASLCPLAHSTLLYSLPATLPSTLFLLLPFSSSLVSRSDSLFLLPSFSLTSPVTCCSEPTSDIAHS